MGDFDQLVLRDFSLAVGDEKRNRADVSGKVADLTRWKGVDLQVKADLRDGEPWRPLLDPKFPVIDTAHVKGRLTDAAGRLGSRGSRFESTAKSSGLRSPGAAATFGPVRPGRCAASQR